MCIKESWCLLKADGAYWSWCLLKNVGVGWRMILFLVNSWKMLGILEETCCLLENVGTCRMRGFLFVFFKILSMLKNIGVY